MRGLARPSIVIPATVLLGWLALALSASWVAPHNPAEQQLEMSLAGPSAIYPLGTDHLGRCLWSRLLFGARLTLGMAVAMSFASVGLGLLVGLAAGYLGGWVDAFLMRLADLVLALPGLVLALAIAGTLGPSMANLGIAIVAVSWAGFSRIFRSQVLSLRERDFVTAARALGGDDPWIARRHLLPHLAATILVMGTVDLGALMLSMSGLSFLGLGAQPPTPEWGAMLNDGRVFLSTAPQLMFLPGFALFSAALAANLLGDALVTPMDPTSDRRTLDVPNPAAPPRGSEAISRAPAGARVKRQAEGLLS